VDLWGRSPRKRAQLCLPYLLSSRDLKAAAAAAGGGECTPGGGRWLPNPTSACSDACLPLCDILRCLCSLYTYHIYAHTFLQEEAQCPHLPPATPPPGPSARVAPAAKRYKRLRTFHSTSTASQFFCLPDLSSVASLVTLLLAATWFAAGAFATPAGITLRLPDAFCCSAPVARRAACSRALAVCALHYGASFPLTTARHAAHLCLYCASAAHPRSRYSAAAMAAWPA